MIVSTERGNDKGMGKGDEALEAAVRVVRATLTDATMPADDMALALLEHRMRGGRQVARRAARGGWRRRSLVFGLVGALAAAVPIGWTVYRRATALTFEVVHGTMAASGEVRTADQDTRIHFSDGSELVLGPEARTQVRDLNANGGRVELTQGRARAYFVPRPHARWQVAAGPYVVLVTGTMFDVQWSDATGGLDVWLHKGSVTVRGPLVEAGVPMTHGQHLLIRPKDNRIVLDNQQEAPAAVPAGAAGDPEPAGQEGTATQGATEEAAAAEPTVIVEQDAPVAPVVEREHEQRHKSIARTHAAPEPGQSWRRILAQGDFEAVVVAAEHRGIDSVLAHGARGDLSALADAARYTRRPRLARQTLLAERERFAASAEGREAAYFLGTLAEAEGATGDALSWYARYLTEDGTGTYAAPALGRSMLLEVHDGAAPAKARAHAEEYLRRFPSGPYAQAARKIVAEPAARAR
jgi:hypothetical protein